MCTTEPGSLSVQCDEDESMDGSSTSGDSAGEGEGWAEADEDPGREHVRCLFCEEVLPSTESAWAHHEQVHRVAAGALAGLPGMDCFGYIKFVNYIRSRQETAEMVTAESVAQMIGDGRCRNLAESQPWLDEGYLKPKDPEDLMLQFDIESVLCPVVENAEMPATLALPPGFAGSGGSAEGVAQAVDSSTAAGSELEMAYLDLRCRFQDLMSEAVCVDGKHKAAAADDGGTDDAYYESYGHFGIHEEMIKDRVRTESYREAILQNGSSLFAGRVVLDVGCGTGILAMFAAQAGARKVYAVDFSDIAFNAMDIVNENRLSNVVVVKHGRVEDLDITEKVDIIISEWMGYGLLFECMLESVLYARDHFLGPAGLVLPDKFNMYLCGLSDEDLFNEHVTFWNDVYGYKMTCMQADVIKEASLTLVRTEAINTTPSCIQSFDLNNHSSDCNRIEFVSDWAMTVQRDSRFIGWVLFFDTHFDRGCDKKVSFSTSPLAEPTHWKQTIFLLRTPVDVRAGEELAGKVAVQKDAKDSRALKVLIQFREQKLKFALR